MSAKRHIASGLLSLVVVVGGVALATFFSVDRDSESERTVGAIPMEEAPNVEVLVVREQPLEDAITLTGGVIPWRDLTLAAETSGKIEWFGAEEGQIASPGQPLVRIDTSALEAELEEVNARLKLARHELERLERLVERGASAMQQLDQARAERDVMAASLQALNVRLDKSVVRAPIRGTVDENYLTVGEYVDPGQPLLRFVQVDKLKLIVGLPERDVPFFEEGQPVDVTFDAIPGKTHQGWIYHIKPTAEPSTRTFTTAIALSNDKRRIRPGMIGRARMIRQTYADSVVVPLFSVINLDDQRVVFVVDDDRVTMRTVETGIVQGSEVQVTAGLSPGDRIIMSGQRNVRPGQRVNVVKVIE